MAIELEWILIPGGECRFGDRGKSVMVRPLWWSRTQITWRHADIGRIAELLDAPLTMISHDRADDIAGTLGGRLPRASEWEWMAAGAARRTFPWGEGDWTPAHANLRASGIRKPMTVGSFPLGATPEGVLDVAGNVWEWTSSEVWGNGFVIRGGSYESPALYSRTRFINAAPKELCSAGIGFRVVRDV